MDPEKIEIDYDHINVASIMEQIKKKVAVESGDGRRTSDDELASPPDIDPVAGQGRTRRILLKLMSPLKPLIKLLVLPIAEEHRRTVLILDHTNRRLDRLEQNFDRLNRLEEYTRLLHHLCHNIVVEMSKLKIEEETLKTKTRIMEKDFDSLGKRERALEKEVFK
jgi:hypothetical protein